LSRFFPTISLPSIFHFTRSSLHAKVHPARDEDESHTPGG
jgi:hypothetical protein